MHNTSDILVSTKKIQALIRSDLKDFQDIQALHKLAQREFGPMAKTVFESWGVTTTADFGEIVFRLIGAGILGKTERDSREDFSDVFDFNDVFEKQYDWNIEGAL